MQLFIVCRIVHANGEYLHLFVVLRAKVVKNECKTKEKDRFCGLKDTAHILLQLFY